MPGAHFQSRSLRLLMKPATQMNFTFRAFAEDTPAAVWQHHFNTLWPAYRRWFLRYGEADRPTYLESIQALTRYMPDFVPVYETMVELAGAAYPTHWKGRKTSPLEGRSLVSAWRGQSEMGDRTLFPAPLRDSGVQRR